MNDNKSSTTEFRFKEWLDSHNIPYWYIQQDIQTFSPALRNYMTRRPDFMVLIPHVGFILVDVEYKKPAKKFEQFYVDEKETKEYCNLQNFFNLQVWYVFSNEGSHYNTWHWIPVSKVLELGQPFSNPKGEIYRAIQMTRLVQISKSDDLGMLFSKMSKFYRE